MSKGYPAERSVTPSPSNEHSMDRVSSRSVLMWHGPTIIYHGNNNSPNNATASFTFAPFNITKLRSAISECQAQMDQLWFAVFYYQRNWYREKLCISLLCSPSGLVGMAPAPLPSSQVLYRCYYPFSWLRGPWYGPRYVWRIYSCCKAMIILSQLAKSVLHEDTW